MAAGTDFILDALTREGLNHLFMVPGGLVDPFLPALARHPSLKPIVAAHEGGAAYMADGYARASGRLRRRSGNWRPWPLQHGGGGGEDGFLSGADPQRRDTAGHGGARRIPGRETLDDTAIMKPITRFSTTVASARNLDHWLRHALTAMLAKPGGPVHLSLTHNALTEDCAADRAHRREDREKLPDAGL